MSARHDVLIAPADGGYSLPDGLVRTWLLQLHRRGIVEPDGEALARTWVEIYLKPGNYAHSPFVEGTAPEGPAFKEAVFHFAEAPEPLPGHPESSAHFWLLLRGAAFEDVLGDFKQRFGELLHCRARALTCEHEGVPPRREVPPDEVRPAAPRRTAPGGAVGTRVEEF